jgi:hypothetical protein
MPTPKAMSRLSRNSDTIILLENDARDRGASPNIRNWVILDTPFVGLGRGRDRRLVVA